MDKSTVGFLGQLYFFVSTRNIGDDMALKKFCLHRGCTTLVESGRCKKHSKDKQLARQQYNKERGSAAARGYDYRWQQYRIRFLALHPLCEKCLLKYRVVPATDVDHIIPVSGPDDPLFWDSDNHQALCHGCHSEKTAMENGGFGNEGKCSR